MSDQMESAQRRVPRWIKIVLGLSLALNLLIIGAVAGTAWRVSKGGDRAGPPAGGYVFVWALERADRQEILSEFRLKNRATHQDRRVMMQEVLEVLRADDFDPATLDGLLSEEASRGAGVREGVQAKVLEKISAMDRDARLAYAERLEEKLQRGKRRKPRKDD